MTFANKKKLTIYLQVCMCLGHKKQKYQIKFKNTIFHTDDG